MNEGKHARHLTPLQVEIMQVLWTRGEATVAEVRAALSLSPPAATTTVATLLSRMLNYGWVDRRKIGREYAYFARLSSNDVRSAKVAGLLQTVFRRDIVSLVNHALSSEDWDAGDIERMKALLQQHEEDIKKDE